MKLVDSPKAAGKTQKAGIQRDSEPASAASQRRFEYGIIGVLVFLCAVVFMAMTDHSGNAVQFTSGETAARSNHASAPATFQEEVSRVVHKFVSHFDGSQSAKSETQDTPEGTIPPALRHIVAGPNQTVLLRRGNAIQALYVLGENGYVVIADNESRLMHFEDLRAKEAAANLRASR